ncbi:LysR family transcriptional regulator [Sphingomonas sp. So64.6b]|uniref:LysR family transcriptional regulator n=1 Tax=Sphingomonas sp. So64.6b TaxID=2997354 RepID=UPI0016049229|nr:LysR family transcriptional regulator [Sphingomonas sp. So64.6b]QNA85212.1 LysR family transcriptional regulator [Sphingomonas sp. So64.6b]
MDRAHLPLNALRAFEASARHLNFTRAGLELCVSQGAVSHQVALLERRLGSALFRRLPRGLALTDEGLALIPVIEDAFDRIGIALERHGPGGVREVLTLGVVGTFAAGWLLDRLPDFTRNHPQVDLRVLTNNNRVDLAGEGLDCAIRFGDGAWHGTQAEPIMDAPLTALCAPSIAARIATVEDLQRETLLRSYRADEWPRWFDQAGISCPPQSYPARSYPARSYPEARGPVFDSSVVMVSMAIAGRGVALAPARMFTRDLTAGRLVQPFATELAAGRYWLTRLMSRPENAAMRAFREWIVAQAA